MKIIDINDKTIHLEALFDDKLIDEFSSFISNYYWTFIYNNTSIPFIISDNPVYIMNFYDKCKDSYLNNTFQINFPLNTRIVLHIYAEDSVLYKRFKNSFNNRLMLINDEETIHSLNMNQCIMSDERIFFSPENEALIDVYFK